MPQSCVSKGILRGQRRAHQSNLRFLALVAMGPQVPWLERHIRFINKFIVTKDAEFSKSRRAWDFRRDGAAERSELSRLIEQTDSAFKTYISELTRTVTTEPVARTEPPRLTTVFKDIYDRCVKWSSLRTFNSMFARPETAWSPAMKQFAEGELD